MKKPVQTIDQMWEEEKPPLGSNPGVNLMLKHAYCLGMARAYNLLRAAAMTGPDEFFHSQLSAMQEGLKAHFAKATKQTVTLAHRTRPRRSTI